LIKLNKIALSVIALSTASISFAASMAPAPVVDVMQYGISSQYNRDTGSMTAGFDIQNSEMEAGLAGSIVLNKIEGVTSNVEYGEYDLSAYLGKRMQLKSNFYGSVGIGGHYTFLSGNWNNLATGITTNEYVVGAYMGLGYQPSENVQIFVRVMPINYEVSPTNKKELEFFHDGQVGMKYFW